MRLQKRETVLYSGHEQDNAPHTEGVALMLSPEAKRSLISWEAAGPRIISAIFKTEKEKMKLNIVQCYAPTNDSDEETKEYFYRRLQSVLDKMKNKDVTILMGDFNAKIGSINRGFEEVMGQQGLRIVNENGELFLDLCAFNRMVIGGSISVFPRQLGFRPTTRLKTR